MSTHKAATPMRALTGGIGLALALTALTLFVPMMLSNASAATWTVDTASRTEYEIRAKWQLLKPTYAGITYSVSPSIRAPYVPGDPAAAFRKDGVDIINFVRYLAGLPHDVALDPLKNVDAQHGAVLLAASNFSHTPARPSDMDLAFYNRALTSTQSSNIGTGYTDIESFQLGCMQDSSPDTIVRVGHRRWLLNPRMKYTGIGFAENRLTTYAFDSSRPAADVAYNQVLWPNAGLFPVELIGSNTPWSVTLNPTKYDWDATREGHTVTLRRIADGRTWTMDAADTNTRGEYFNADFGGYGVANAFIFRPDPTTITYRAGDEFEVTLSGGIYADGTREPASVTYRTRLMSLDGQTAPPPPALVDSMPNPVVFEQDDPRIAYVGAWNTWENAALSGGSYAYGKSGTGATAHFTGTRLDMTFRTGPEFGIAKITVDGTTVTTVDLYSGTARFKQRLFSTGDLPDGPHVVNIEWTDTKNPYSSSTYINLDAIEIAGSLSQAPVRIEQHDARFSFAGNWSSWSNALLSGGSYKYAGATASSIVTFEGTRLDLIARTGPEFGIAKVSVDGVATNVDLYSATALYRQKVFTTGELPAGRHTVTVEWTGTKNPNATATYINVDAADLLIAVPVPLLNPAVAQQDDYRMGFNGSWATWAHQALSGGSYTYSATKGAAVRMAFQGTRLDLIARTGPEFGIAKVTIDDTVKVYVDLYSASTKYQQLVFTTWNLPEGTHSVKVEYTGSKNTKSMGAYVNVDAVHVQGSLLPVPVRVEQSDQRISFQGSWSSWSHGELSGGSYSYASSAATSTVTFYGTKLDVISRVGPEFGIAKVTVDGSTVTLVDLYASSTYFQKHVFSTGELPHGQHTLTIEWTGTKNKYSSGTYIDLDAVEVSGLLM